MRRIICCGLLALLLLSSGAVFAQTRFAAARSHPRIIVVHRFFHFHPYYFFPAAVSPAPFLNPGPYSTAYSVPNFVVPSPEYVFVGSDSPARVPLVFKDGTSYFVSDYWRVDDQLHFNTSEEGGTKSVPHSVPFDSLDVQRTKDVGAAQGFRFVLRDEPIEQWLEHHAAQQQQTPSRRTGTTGKR